MQNAFDVFFFVVSWDDDQTIGHGINLFIYYFLQKYDLYNWIIRMNFFCLIILNI